MHVSVIFRPGWAAAADLWPPLGLLSTVRHFAFACCFCLLLWQHLHLHSTMSIEKLRIRAVYISNLLPLNSYRKFFYTCRKFKISYSTCNIVVSMGNCFSKHEYLSGKKNATLIIRLGVLHMFTVGEPDCYFYWQSTAWNSCLDNKHAVLLLWHINDKKKFFNTRIRYRKKAFFFSKVN